MTTNDDERFHILEKQEDLESRLKTAEKLLATRGITREMLGFLTAVRKAKYCTDLQIRNLGTLPAYVSKPTSIGHIAFEQTFSDLEALQQYLQSKSLPTNVVFKDNRYAIIVGDFTLELYGASQSTELKEPQKNDDDDIPF